MDIVTWHVKDNDLDVFLLQLRTCALDLWLQKKEMKLERDNLGWFVSMGLKCLEKQVNIIKSQQILIAIMAIQLDLQLPYDDFRDQLMIVESIIGFNSSQFNDRVGDERKRCHVFHNFAASSPMDITIRFTTQLVPFMPKSSRIYLLKLHSAL